MHFSMVKNGKVFTETKKDFRQNLVLQLFISFVVINIKKIYNQCLRHENMSPNFSLTQHEYWIYSAALLLQLQTRTLVFNFGCLFNLLNKHFVAQIKFILEGNHSSYLHMFGCVSRSNWAIVWLLIKVTSQLLD